MIGQQMFLLVLVDVMAFSILSLGFVAATGLFGKLLDCPPQSAKGPETVEGESKQ